MTLQEVNKMIEEMADAVGCEYAYYTFDREEGEVKPPFLIFYYPNNDDLYADDTNYCKVKALTIEFYTDFKDFDSEALIEKVLDDYGITYDSESVFVSGEHLYEQIYTMEVVING